MPSNDLYLTVLPIIHVSDTPYAGFGLTEQVLTLFPDRNLATEFSRIEAENFINVFKTRATKYLTSGRVIGYDYNLEEAGDGLVVVRVTQNVS